MIKKKKIKEVFPIIATTIGVIMSLIGLEEQGKAIDSNLFLFGMIIQLFALHLYNSNDIDKLKENKK